jgi:membrane-associated phospholipid phosphatase
MKLFRQLSAMRVIDRLQMIGLLLLIGLTWLAQEIWEKESFAFDARLLWGLHQWANPVLDQVMLGITRLGDPEVVVVVVLGTCSWLGFRRRWRSLVMLCFLCLGTQILNQGMKLAFARPRPLLWPRLIEEASYSFPSGHAMGSLVLYGFLAYLLRQRYPRQARLITGIAIGLIGAIGLSRLYLGVHYPTDILAGYAAGGLWLMTCLGLLRMNGRRRDRPNL